MTRSSPPAAQAPQSTESRRAPRKRAGAAIKVTNTITEQVMGRLGNLSAEGMLLVANQPIAENALFQFRFDLPATRGRADSIEVGVHEQWAEPASVPGQYWVGFRFIDIGAEDFAVLSRWLNSDGGRLD
ncbi:MAG TPA: PilZ domain-containing protein [Rhodanobacteraceae bacterium]|nr:PilZ domain-containing protein [Rhodanobacteraceae bacterium]